MQRIKAITLSAALVINCMQNIFAETALYTTVNTLSMAVLTNPKLQLMQPSPFTVILPRFLKSQNLLNYSVSFVNNTMVESARSRQKRKTSIRSAFWVNGLIIDSVHFLMEKSIHFINWARLEEAQLINQITVFSKSKASYGLSSSYNVKGVNR